MDGDLLQWHKATWGRPLTIITWSCVVFMSGLLIFSFFIEPLVAQIALGVMPVLILSITSLFSIKGFALQDKVLFVQRLLWIDRIDLQDLTEAAFQPKITRLSLKTLGNGGLFSFCGWFWNKRLGHFRAYITDAQNDIVLKIGTRTIVISPDNPEKFTEKLNAIIGQNKES